MRLSDAELESAASRNTLDAKVLRAIMRVESGGPGFSSDGRPLISFEPYWFSQLSGGRFDASHPQISNPNSRAYLGGNQASRWQKLTEAYALDAEAALGATSWGVFQLPGRYYDDAGYGDIFSFVRDVTQSEVRQLMAFESYARRKELMDELRNRDWATFAQAFEGDVGAQAYANALAAAFQALTVAMDPYLDSLVVQNPARLTRADFEAVATELGCEVEAIQAVAEVEVGSHSAFGANGRPTILYEPHIFSRRTNHAFDASNPNVSYPNWTASRYPRSQDGRWAQLREAYGLNGEEAVASASWGMFQIMGFNFAACGFANARDFVADMAKSEARQLAAFSAFVRSNGLADELQRRDWAGFARRYNGPAYAENRYDQRMAEAYDRLKNVS